MGRAFLWVIVQEKTQMVLSFAEQQPASSAVHVVLSNSADNEEGSAETIVASRVNPYTYTFNSPPGQW